MGMSGATRGEGRALGPGPASLFRAGQCSCWAAKCPSAGSTTTIVAVIVFGALTVPRTATRSFGASDVSPGADGASVVVVEVVVVVPPSGGSMRQGLPVTTA